jgi:hypothetical protein
MKTRTVKRVALCLVGALWAWVHPGAGSAEANPEAIGYNRRVRPLLSDRCFFCHGPDKAHRKSGLRLDVREAAIKEGAIVPGKPDESELVKRITTTDTDDLMPPAESHKSLTPADKDILRRWIEEGAVYEPHWAYVPVKRPEVPGPGHPIDAFIGKRLAQANLAPSAEADRRTLLRRLSLDLIGLPPTPEDVATFVNDKSPRAFEKQVARLLASPHFGERMAVPWLDVARFADTVGYHGDQNQNIFPYRDYVIASFNANKPFDRFTIEQLAGDLLPNPTVEQKIASGFNRLNMVTREGGAQAREYLAKYMADRVRAVGTVWLGATLGCAQCHDHKYDPITARDFYQMGAFFADIREWGVYHDYQFTPNKDLEGWSNEHPFPPELEVASPYQARRGKRLRAELASRLGVATVALEKNAGRTAEFSQWKQEITRYLRVHPDGWARLATLGVEAAKHRKATTSGDGTILIESTGKTSWEEGGVTNVVRGSPAPGWLAAVRIDVVPHAALGGRATLRGDTDSVSVTATLVRAAAVAREAAKSAEGGGNTPAPKDQDQVVEGHVPLRFHFGEADRKEPVYRSGFEVHGIARAWKPARPYTRDGMSGVWELAEPVRVEPGDRLMLKVNSGSLGAFRVSTSPLASFAAATAPPHIEVANDKPQQRSARGRLATFVRQGLGEKTQPGVAEVFLLSTSADPEVRAQAQHLLAEIAATRDGRAPTLVTVAQTPRPTRILPRGNWQDETGELVAPDVPHFLPPLDPSVKSRRPTRLDLARWLVSRGNPLTARTFINRLWKQFFGEGLSSVLDDLGAQGETPTHAELLDYLAAHFMDSGWDVKRVIELIVTSRTYRQASTATEALLAADLQNRLYARQSQRRLDAEFIRDNALFVAGLLERQLGGPSVHPYQPEGYYDNIEFPKRTYVTEADERQYRRGVYVHWQRTFLHPMMVNFDAPSREECTADRPKSNTPQQALTLLNDPVFVEAARALAARALAQQPKLDDDRRLDQTFERVLGRKPSATEGDALLSLLNDQRAHFAGKPEAARALARPSGVASDGDVVEQAAWISVSRVILNFYEAVTRV